MIGRHRFLFVLVRGVSGRDCSPLANQCPSRTLPSFGRHPLCDLSHHGFDGRLSWHDRHGQPRILYGFPGDRPYGGHRDIAKKGRAPLPTISMKFVKVALLVNVAIDILPSKRKRLSLLPCFSGFTAR